MAKHLECSVPVNLILEAANRLYSFDKVPFALTLVHEVLRQHPEHPGARKLYETLTDEPVPPYPADKNYRMYYDPELDKFVVEDTVSGRKVLFDSSAEAEAYMGDA